MSEMMDELDKLTVYRLDVNPMSKFYVEGIGVKLYKADDVAEMIRRVEKKGN